MGWERRRSVNTDEQAATGGARPDPAAPKLVIDLREHAQVAPNAGPDHRPFRAEVVSRLVERHRELIRMTIDVSSWLVGFLLAAWLRFDFTFIGWTEGLFALFVFGSLLQLGVGFLLGLYVGRWRFGSFEEVAAVVRATVLVGMALLLLDALASPRLVPLSVAVGGMVVALVAQLGARYLWRLLVELQNRPGAHAERVLIYGAGEGGYQLITSMMRDPQSPYVPVAVVDDDPRKRNLRLRGIPLAGDRHDLGRVARDYEANHLVIAIPRASSALLQELSRLALDADLKVSVLPAVEALLGDEVQIADVRPLDERDLLGRHEITTDVDQIAGYLTGQRILVTGAGGSIGSELCRQIQRFSPAQLVMLDRDESALHAVQLSIEGRAMLDARNLVVANIRDRARLREVFVEHRPQVVFHAAALKHLPLLEMYPEEAIKTNVVGSLNLLELAAEFDVERFVNVSTDKAADPSSVLGYTKRIAERLTAQVAGEASGTYLSVRFGNVLGSRGSVLTAFREQIAGGGPVTVTHPEVTRYFMTVEEAVQLVVQAGAIGRSGEALVLDMGAPVRIADVAARLVAQAERPVEIVYTGLRPGEKLHEVLLGVDEVDDRPVHPLISHVPVPPLETDAVSRLTPAQLVDLSCPNGQRPADTRRDVPSDRRTQAGGRLRVPAQKMK